MQYIKGTIGLPLILSIDKDGNIKCYVDVEFAAHKDTSIHSCGLTNMVT